MAELWDGYAYTPDPGYQAIADAYELQVDVRDTVVQRLTALGHDDEAIKIVELCDKVVEARTHGLDKIDQLTAQTRELRNEKASIEQQYHELVFATPHRAAWVALGVMVGGASGVLGMFLHKLIS